MVTLTTAEPMSFFRDRNGVLWARTIGGAAPTGIRGQSPHMWPTCDLWIAERMFGPFTAEVRPPVQAIIDAFTPRLRAMMEARS